MSVIGLRIRRPDNGAILLDTSTSMTRVLGKVTTAPNQTGQVSHAGFATGQGFFVVYPLTAITPNDTFPDVELINNQTITWTAATVGVLIVYGVKS